MAELGQQRRLEGLDGNRVVAESGHVLGHRTDVAQGQHGAGRRHLPVRGDRERAQRAHCVQPRREQLRAVRGQVPVPYVEGRGHGVGVTPPAAGGLQQRGPLLEHPLVVGPHAGQAWHAGHDQLVEDAAPLARLAAHDSQVLGGEQHRPDGPEDVTRTRLRRAVEAGPVGPPGRDLDLDLQLASGRDHRRAQQGPFGTGTHQRRVARDPVAAEGRQVPDRLDQVGLALPVRADENARSGLERELGVRPTAEVRDGQVSHPHGAPTTARQPAQPGSRTGIIT